MKTLSEIKETDRVRTKDGRVGTAMLVMTAPNGDVGLCVEFDDTAPDTEIVELTDVAEVL